MIPAISTMTALKWSATSVMPNGAGQWPICAARMPPCQTRAISSSAATRCTPAPAALTIR